MGGQFQLMWIGGSEMDESVVESPEVFPGVVEMQLVPGLRGEEVLMDGIGGFQSIDFHFEDGFFEGFGDGDQGGDVVLDVANMLPGRPTAGKENQQEKVETEPEFFRERGTRQGLHRVSQKNGQGSPGFWCNHFRLHSRMVCHGASFTTWPPHCTWAVPYGKSKISDRRYEFWLWPWGFGATVGLWLWGVR